MGKPIYKRVLIKLSGEALSAGATGEILDFGALRQICTIVKQLHNEGVQIALVIGGGNIWRGGRNDSGIERTRADDMGMLATMINAVAAEAVLRGMDVDAKVLSAVEMNKIAELFTARRADECLNNGQVVILGGGTGNPLFTTDTGAVLRAIEIKADVALLAKNVGGVYDDDPNKNKKATKFDEISYSELLSRGLGVIDTSAACLAQDSGLPVLLFALKDPNNITRAVHGEKVGTVIKKI